MKTEDFIKALAADPIVERHAVGRALAFAVPLAVLAATLGFLGLEGVRQGLATPEILPIVARKLAFTFSLALCAGVLALRAARPRGADGWAIAALIVPLLVLAFFLGDEIARLGFVNWRARMMGQFSWICTAAICTMAAPLLAAFLWAQAKGAPDNPLRAGALAGAAATGIAASIYALHCTDDSALFMGLWYVLAGGLTSLVGALAARRALAW